MKKFIRNISPFNNRTEMPAAVFVIKKLLAFILCFIAGTLAGNVLVIGAMIAGGKNFTQGETFSESTMGTLGLYAMAGMIAASVLYWKFIEKRKLSEMGVTKNVSGWFTGAGVGILLLIVSVSAIMVTGAIKLDGFSTDFNAAMFLLMLGGYAVQGATEEFLCRGVVFSALKDKVSLPAALGASALAFILPHMSTLMDAEPMFIILGVINLTAISCLFSFVMLRTGNIWAACGLHSLWNFILESVCGLTVSGSEGAKSSIINMHAEGENLLNGGIYGIEASLVTFVVIAAASGIIYYSIKKKGRNAENGVQ